MSSFRVLLYPNNQYMGLTVGGDPYPTDDVQQAEFFSWDEQDNETVCKCFDMFPQHNFHIGNVTIDLEIL